MIERTTITVVEAHERMKAQGVDRADIAFVCPVCGTVQSMRSLIAAGAPPEKAETYVGFSCEGRFSNGRCYTSHTQAHDIGRMVS